MCGQLCLQRSPDRQQRQSTVALKVASRERSLVPHERSLTPSRTFPRPLANVPSPPRERSLVSSSQAGPPLRICVRVRRT